MDEVPFSIYSEKLDLNQRVSGGGFSHGSSSTMLLSQAGF